MILTTLAACTAGWAGDLPPFVKQAHRPSLQAFLAGHSYCFIAPEEVCDCADDLASRRQSEPAFHPYYAVGDINDDGIEDFAVGLLDRRDKRDEPRLTVVVFHGPFSGGRVRAGVTVFRSYRITRASEAISVFKPRVEDGGASGRIRYPARLNFGNPFDSDDIRVILYDWKRKRYVVSR